MGGDALVASLDDDEDFDFDYSVAVAKVRALEANARSAREVKSVLEVEASARSAREVKSRLEREDGDARVVVQRHDDALLAEPQLGRRHTTRGKPRWHARHLGEL